MYVKTSAETSVFSPLTGLCVRPHPTAAAAATNANASAEVSDTVVTKRQAQARIQVQGLVLFHSLLQFSTAEFHPYLQTLVLTRKSDLSGCWGFPRCLSHDVITVLSTDLIVSGALSVE